MATATALGLPPSAGSGQGDLTSAPTLSAQYNGNVERLNLTLDREWAYVRFYTSN